MYAQRTAASLARGLGAAPGADDVAYASVLSAWKDYLANDNDALLQMRRDIENGTAIGPRITMMISMANKATKNQGMILNIFFMQASVFWQSQRGG